MVPWMCFASWAAADYHWRSLQHTAKVPIHLSWHVSLQTVDGFVAARSVQLPAAACCWIWGFSAPVSTDTEHETPFPSRFVGGGLWKLPGCAEPGTRELQEIGHFISKLLWEVAQAQPQPQAQLQPYTQPQARAERCQAINPLANIVS